MGGSEVDPEVTAESAGHGFLGGPEVCGEFALVSALCVQFGGDDTSELFFDAGIHTCDVIAGWCYRVTDSATCRDFRGDNRWITCGLLLVQNLLGHASPTTTQVYTDFDRGSSNVAVSHLPMPQLAPV